MIDDVSRGVLDRYVALLLKWNKAINLISESTEKDVWNRHIEDSLQLMNFLDMSDNICDVGSGAGLPGIVLSIAGVKNVTLVESDQRKASFLLQARKLSSNKIDVINDRVENLDCIFDVVISRAFAEISEIFLKVRARRYLLLKGKRYKEELDRASQKYTFDYHEHHSITSIDGVILDIKNVKWRE